jgi:hypothetical protein
MPNILSTFCGACLEEFAPPDDGADYSVIKDDHL